MYVSVYERVSVCEREREREKERKGRVKIDGKRDVSREKGIANKKIERKGE